MQSSILLFDSPRGRMRCAAARRIRVQSALALSGFLMGSIASGATAYEAATADGVTADSIRSDSFRQSAATESPPAAAGSPLPSREDAESAYRDGRHKEAFAAWSKAAAAAPQDARAWLRVGNLWQRAGDLTRAAQAYRTAMDGQPEDARARAALNLALLGLGQASSALRSLDPRRLPSELRPMALLLEQQLAAAQVAADAVASTAVAPPIVLAPATLGAP